MSLPDAALLDAFSLAELRGVAGRLVGDVRRLHSDNAALQSGAEAQQAMIAELLNGIGVEISKRLAVRLLAEPLDTFVAKEQAAWADTKATACGGRRSSPAAIARGLRAA